MFKKIQAKLKSKKGFTLVELLIVIAVLGIIAAIAVPRFAGVLGGVRGNSDTRAAQLWVKEIEASVMVGQVQAIAVSGSATITATAPSGFVGTVPPSQVSGTTMIATVNRDAAGAYTVTITNGAAQNAVTLVNAAPISGPVN